MQLLMSLCLGTCGVLPGCKVCELHTADPILIFWDYGFESAHPGNKIYLSFSEHRLRNFTSCVFFVNQTKSITGWITG